MQEIRPNRADAALVDGADDDVLVRQELRDEVAGRGFEKIDFSGDQRVHRGRRIGNDVPFHAIDLDRLAAGQPAGRLAPRDQWANRSGETCLKVKCLRLSAAGPGVSQSIIVCV